MTDQQRPSSNERDFYHSGFTWPVGWFSGKRDRVLQVFALLAEQMADGLLPDEVEVIELWYNETTGHKGLYTMDTSRLPAEGWTKLATL
jgi:hypothetical protein